jgi:hypothetical protein
MTSNITLDSSTPALTTDANSNSVTSASFSPPADSLLVILCAFSQNYSSSPTISDSVGGSYSHPVHYSSNAFGSNEGVDIYIRYLTTAPGSMTVTYTVNGGLSASTNNYIHPLVLNNADSDQSGVETDTSSSGLGGSSSAEVTFTPTYSGSWIVGMSPLLVNSAGTTATGVSGMTTIDNTIGAGASDAVLDGANETGPSGSTTFGWTFNKSNVTNVTGAMEIREAANPPVTVDLLTAQVNIKAISPTVEIGAATVVNLLTAQVTVGAYSPTAEAYTVTSGGPGTPGLIKITYLSPLVEALAYSISPTATTDPYGNELPIGYQGPISAIEPGSSPIVTETWHQATLNATDCAASGNGVNGMFYQYTPDNEVELVWDLTLTGSGITLATLPTAYTPSVPQNIITSWYGTGPASYSDSFSPHLQILTSGVIQANGCESLAISLAGRAKYTLDSL